MRRVVLIVLFLVVSFLASIFAYKNPSYLSVDLGFRVYNDISLSLLLISSFVIGWLVGIVFSFIFMARFYMERRLLRKSLRLAEEEISNLRSLPLQDAN